MDAKVEITWKKLIHNFNTLAKVRILNTVKDARENMTLKKDITNKVDVCEIRKIHPEKIEKAKSEAIPENELEQMGSIFKMLGDTTRLKILLALRENEMCVCDLAAFADLTESAVSHQLRRLKDQSLVKKRRDGQILYYSLNDEHVTDLLQISLDHMRE